EGEEDEAELRHRGRAAELHPRGLAPRRADQRQRRLEQRHEEGEDEGVMAEFGDQFFVSAVFCWSGCQWPLLFSASATSGGMYFSSCLASTVAAWKTPSLPSRPSATTPWPSRKRSGSVPV